MADDHPPSYTEHGKISKLGTKEAVVMRSSRRKRIGSGGSRDDSPVVCTRLSKPRFSVVKRTLSPRTPTLL